MIIEHKHHDAPKSEEADRIEQDIDVGLEHLDTLFKEIRRRFRVHRQSLGIARNKWVWVLAVLLILSLRTALKIRARNKTRCS